MINKQMPTVFLDTNIFKFADFEKYKYIKEPHTVNWGGKDFEVMIDKTYRVSSLDKIKNISQRKDATMIGLVAYGGVSKKISLFTHKEVKYELWGLKGGLWQPNLFGHSIPFVEDPHPEFERILIGGGKTFKQNKQDFLQSIDHPRFIDLLKMTGAYQGKKPINVNQGLDAYHIWCAENSKIEYFLTMDNSLQRVVAQSKVKTNLKIVTPSELLRDALPRLGFFSAMLFLWQGYRYAKPYITLSKSSRKA